MWYLKVERTVIFVSLLAMAFIASANAQTEYRLISTAKPSTFQAELDVAAQQGFKVMLVGQSVRVSSLTVLVARPQGSKREPVFEYKLLGFGDFKKLKDQLGKAGFHSCGALYPNGLFGMVTPPFFLLERSLAMPGVVEFQIIESKKETERQRKINAAAADGFVPVSVTHAYVLLQRDATNASGSTASSQEYRLFDTYKVSTLEKEMNLVAKDGFCLVLSGALNTVIMAKEKSLPGAAQCEYRVVSLSESEKQMQQVVLLAKDQFRYQSATQLGAAAIFERRTGSQLPITASEFKVLETNSEETMERELSEATGAGFIPLSIGHGAKGFISIFLFREASSNSKP
jgi:hypothetical protein